MISQALTEKFDSDESKGFLAIWRQIEDPDLVEQLRYFQEKIKRLEEIEIIEGSNDIIEPYYHFCYSVLDRAGMLRIGVHDPHGAKFIRFIMQLDTEDQSTCDI